MRTPKQSGLFDVATKLDRLRDHIGRQLESAAENHGNGLSQSWSEEQAILQAMPDYIFRIRRNGSVSVAGNGSHGHVATGVPTPRRSPADTAAKSQGRPGKKVEPWDPAKSLSEELARQSKELVTKAVQTGQVQIFDIQLRHGSQTVCYEVRAVVCNRNEVLAVARDVTARREAENALRKLKDDLERQRSILKEGVYKEKENAYQKKLRDYQLMVKDANEELQNRDQEISKKMIPDIMKVVQAIGEKEKYTLILDVSTIPVAYYNKENDLTKRVTDEFNKASKATRK